MTEYEDAYIAGFLCLFFVHDKLSNRLDLRAHRLLENHLVVCQVDSEQKVARKLGPSCAQSPIKYDPGQKICR